MENTLIMPSCYVNVSNEEMEYLDGGVLSRSKVYDIVSTTVIFTASIGIIVAGAALCTNPVTMIAGIGAIAFGVENAVSACLDLYSM